MELRKKLIILNNNFYEKKSRGGKMKLKLFLGAVSVLLVVYPGEAKYESYSVEGGGSISGKVTFAGKIAKQKKIIPTSDKTVCGAHQAIYSEELVLDSSKGVKNVVVLITNITRGLSTRSLPQAVLDQKGCVFRPHVLVVPIGQAVTVRNSDGIIHNLHTQSIKNPPVNLAQPGSAKEISLNPFKIPELVKVNCDIHGWMSAWLWVTEHPYAAVTKEDGSFQISDIPPGKYKLEFWQETLGKLSQEVEVKGDQETKINLVYPAK
mgnify:CR=1 FL=1